MTVRIALRLVEPRKRGAEERHLRTPVADDHRPSAPPPRSSRGRRTRRSPAQSRAAPRQPSRSRPCRRRGGTAAIRRRRAGPSAQTSHRAEGETDDPPPGDERERQPGAATSARSSGARSLEERILLGARPRCDLEAAGTKLVDRLRPPGGTRPRDEARREDHPVGEHRDEEPLDVLGNDEASPFDERPCASGALEREAAANRAADDDCLVLSRRPDELDHPAVQHVVDVHVLGRRAQLVHVVDRRRPAAARASGCTKRWFSRTRSSSSISGIAERDPEEEAVELRLGERERALVLDRILGREQEERATEARVSRRRPSPGCSAIASSSADCVFGVARLISSTRTTFAKIGPGRNSKSRVFWSKTESPVTSVGWRSGVHWIRDGTDALDAAADRAREHGLRGAGDVLEQHVAAAHERGQDELDLVALAVDDRLDVVEQARRDVDRGREAIRFLGAFDPRLHRPGS